jgi:hypothetical protein
MLHAVMLPTYVEAHGSRRAPANKSPPRADQRVVAIGLRCVPLAVEAARICHRAVRPRIWENRSCLGCAREQGGGRRHNAQSDSDSRSRSFNRNGTADHLALETFSSVVEYTTLSAARQISAKPRASTKTFARRLAESIIEARMTLPVKDTGAA